MEGKEVERIAAGIPFGQFIMWAIGGGIAGYLVRPSIPLFGQLPVGIVLTRGSTLTGIDQLFVPVAQTSFNYVIAGVVVGVIALFGFSMTRR